MQRRILFAAAHNFLTKGIDGTKVADVANTAQISLGSLTHIYATKEDILYGLVEYVLEGQWSSTETFLMGRTEDPVLFYAAETTLQLYIAELNENLRGLYSAAYSYPKTSALIQKNITDKLQKVFAEYVPEWGPQEFYKREIASGGIIRGYMTVPCDIWFTMEQKAEAFIETSLLIYHVPGDKIKEAIDFVKQFDYPLLAQKIIDGMYRMLKDADSLNSTGS